MVAGTHCGGGVGEQVVWCGHSATEGAFFHERTGCRSITSNIRRVREVGVGVERGVEREGWNGLGLGGWIGLGLVVLFPYRKKIQCRLNRRS